MPTADVAPIISQSQQCRSPLLHRVLSFWIIQAICRSTMDRQAMKKPPSSLRAVVPPLPAASIELDKDLLWLPAQFEPPPPAPNDSCGLSLHNQSISQSVGQSTERTTLKCPSVPSSRQKKYGGGEALKSITHLTNRSLSTRVIFGSMSLNSTPMVSLMRCASCSLLRSCSNFARVSPCRDFRDFSTSTRRLSSSACGPGQSEMYHNTADRDEINQSINQSMTSGLRSSERADGLSIEKSHHDANCDAPQAPSAHQNRTGRGSYHSVLPHLALRELPALCSHLNLDPLELRFEAGPLQLPTLLLLLQILQPHVVSAKPEVYGPMCQLFLCRTAGRVRVWTISHTVV